jgi:hypothetical protein
MRHAPDECAGCARAVGLRGFPVTVWKSLSQCGFCNSASHRRTRTRDWIWTPAPQRTTTPISS